ncbi:RRM domain-containing protein [Podarcis lilfordi]|uniref:RRM domain-containing protein n=1 Tax=Podarcis lilfordi TaxID=74358 RepID=A0AA35LHU9_9SAUR|nr:RRM domain-containing protein [Podarcis lilfordi]
MESLWMGVRSEWTRLENPPVALLEAEGVDVDSPEEVEDMEVAVMITEAVAMVDLETIMAAGTKEAMETVTLGAPTEITMITSLHRA